MGLLLSFGFYAQIVVIVRGETDPCSPWQTVPSLPLEIEQEKETGSKISSAVNGKNTAT